MKMKYAEYSFHNSQKPNNHHQLYHSFIQNIFKSSLHFHLPLVGWATYDSYKWVRGGMLPTLSVLRPWNVMKNDIFYSYTVISLFLRLEWINRYTQDIDTHLIRIWKSKHIRNVFYYSALISIPCHAVDVDVSGLAD